MSGGAVAYNLRPNKAVERNLFIDLLQRIGRYANISDYAYYSFGGPFLEDFKLAHAQLRISKLWCIEEDVEVVKRQRFNLPIDTMQLYEGSAGIFLSSFFPNEPCIFWLDYASPRQLDNQLTEFGTLLGKLSPGDVFKVTLNANPSSLVAKDNESPEDLWKKQLDKLRTRIPRYAPAGLMPEDMRISRFPRVLMNALHRAVELARLPKNIVALPLSAFVYTDVHQMLTLTGVMLDREEVEPFFDKTRLRHWPFGTLDWEEDPKGIQVPDLSLRERLRLEAKMPDSSVEDLMTELGFHIADSQIATEGLLESFKMFYRLLPQYSRVVF